MHLSYLVMLYRPCGTLNHPEEPGQGLCILCILHFQQMGFEACESVISNFGTLDRQRTIISMNFGAFLDHLVALLCHLSRLNSRVLWASSWLPPIFWRWCSAWPFSGIRRGELCWGEQVVKNAVDKKRKETTTPTCFLSWTKGLKTI